MKWKRSKKSSSDVQRRPDGDKRSDTTNETNSQNTSNDNENVELYEMDDESDIDIDDIDSDSNDEKMMTMDNIANTQSDLLRMPESEFRFNNLLPQGHVQTS